MSVSRDGAEAAPEDTDDDRPTVLPPFDADAFARESEMRIARLVDASPLDAEAKTLSSECSAALERDCWSTIGSGSAILGTTASPDELKGFGLDHVSGFLLSLMDGVTDVEMLLDICGLPRLLALRHLRDLVVRGIVIEKPPPRSQVTLSRG